MVINLSRPMLILLADAMLFMAMQLWLPFGEDINKGLGLLTFIAILCSPV